MAFASHPQPARNLRRGGTIATLTASLLLGACGQTLSPAGGNNLLSVNGEQKPQKVAANQPAPPPQSPAAAGGVSDELLQATDYWGKAYAKSPRDLPAALNYARNLKAMGEKRRALTVLQQVSLYHGQDRELASEYGRLALDLDQVNVAKQLLAIADDPARPDWRVVSARGAVLAKEGNYNEAIPYFERARVLSNDQPSVLSNLALAQAMNGEPGKAEAMLRQAAAGDAGSPRIRQNLALVLGLQGKYDEAKIIAARDIPPTNAAENADYLRQVVKLEPKPIPGADPQPWETNSKIAEAPTVNAVPVEKVAKLPEEPVADPGATRDSGWVVDGAAPLASAAPANGGGNGNVMSVAEMAAQFAVSDDDESSAAAKKAPAKSPAQVAQAKH